MQIDAAKVTLKLEPDTQCSDCKSRCHDSFLNFLFHRNHDGILSVALNKEQTKYSHLDDKNKFFNDKPSIGDIVGIKFNESQLFKLALILYGLPIMLIVLLLIAGYYSFAWFNLNTDVGGIIGLVTGLFLARYLIQFNNSRIKPQVSFFSSNS